VIAAARAEGAAAVRIASAEPDAATLERMRAAFARGDHATWAFGEEYARKASDPSYVLAGAQSVICCAFPYATPAPLPRRGHGRVSAYAWSTDYHGRVHGALRRIARRIDALAGAAVTRAVIDTAPLAERAFAARAGLGWIGKHTGLIVKGVGGAVYLGEVVTTLALAPDAALQTNCGSCTRCIDVCPTGALRGDSTIDATRCISDLTQRSDDIPVALRPLLGTWIWGCDLCTDICPPTRIAGPRGGPADAPRNSDTAAPELAALLRSNGSQFRSRYRRSGMGWRGHAVLRRNAAVALGNTLDRAAIPALGAALTDDRSAMVRGHAAWALGRLGGAQAYGVLQHALDAERDAGVRSEIHAALEPRPDFRR
jgi:epoxyqueuosine reductase